MTGNAVQCKVLGPLVLEREGEPLALGAGRPRHLLAILLAADGAPVSRDRLIDELWGERPPATAASALHVHLSKLRAVVGDVLVLGPGGYQLDPALLVLDVTTFDAFVERSRREPANRAALLAQAEELVRGEPLADLEADGTVARWRDALAARVLNARRLRVDAEIAAGRAADVVPDLEAMLAQHPYDEGLWGQLMRALYRSGRGADALDAFQRARRTLADQLGLEPGRELVELQEQILRHDGTLAPAAPPAPPRRQSTLPRPPTPLVGRQRELALLEDLMVEPDAPLVSIVGPGGVGKTRLGLELARRQEPAYADGAVFVQLERIADPELLPLRIGSAVGRASGERTPAGRNLWELLADRELLLVLDNFEHLLDGTQIVSEILAVAPGVRILTTSRAPLRLRSEHVFTLAPLSLPASEHPQAIAASDAVQLFLRQARAADHTLDTDDPLLARRAAAVCEALDGLPLAIELAAARAGLVGLGLVEDELAQPLLVGEHQLRDLPERQQSLQRTIRWSFDLLSADSQRALLAAGVCVGGFTVDALGAISGAPAEAAVKELVAASLMRRLEEDGRYDLLVLVRAFAQQEAEDLDALAARHCAHFADQIVAVRAGLPAIPAPGQVARALRPDHENYGAALGYALTASDIDRATTLFSGMRPIWTHGMLRDEGLRSARGVLALDGIQPADQLTALALGSYLEPTDAAAVDWSRRLADLALEQQDWTRYALGVQNLVDVAVQSDDREAIAELVPELKLAAAHAGPLGAALAHHALALQAYLEGRFDIALAHAARIQEKSTDADLGSAHIQGSVIRLLARSARDRQIRREDVVAHLDLAGDPNRDQNIIGLWIVGRYAAGIGSDSALRWLAYAEHFKQETGAGTMWPDQSLRDEALSVLGLDDPSELLGRYPVPPPQAALAEASVWIAGRPADEVSPRVNVAEFLNPGGR